MLNLDFGVSGVIGIFKIDSMNMIVGFSVFFCIYEVEQMWFVEQLSQKCEQFLYEILLGICLGCLVLNGLLTSLKHPSDV